MTAPRLLLVAGLLLNPATGRFATAEEPYLERWGIDEVTVWFDYHEGTNRMLTQHCDRAVLWDVETGLAVQDYPAGSEPLAPHFTADGKSMLMTSGNGWSGASTLRRATMGRLRCGSCRTCGRWPAWPAR